MESTGIERLNVGESDCTTCVMRIRGLSFDQSLEVNLIGGLYGY